MKRRIVAFLILVLAATSSGLIFRIGEPHQNIKLSESPNRTQFYEALPSEQSGESTTNKNNLTKSFAEQITKDWIEKNPMGPEFIDGQQWLNVPRPEAIVQSYLEKEIKKFDPNDLVPTINDNDIKISYEKTSSVLEEYADLLQKMQEVITRTSVNQVNFSIEDAKKISEANNLIADLLKSALVPDILMPFHKQQLQFVLFQKNLIDALANYEQDPVQAILISQNSEFYSKLLEENFKKLEQETKNLQTISFNDYYGDNDKSLAAKIFFIEKAHAVGKVVIDPTLISTTIRQWAKDALRWASEHLHVIATETLRKRLLDMIVDQIVRWIQGGGEPKFITDWRGFMSDAFDIAFDETIKQLGMGFVCSPFNLQTRRLLERPPTFPQQITCRLDQVVKNIDDFYNNFQSGGWAAYQTMWQPEGNPFGLSLLGYDRIVSRAAEEQDARRLEGIAGQGFLSAKRCVAYYTEHDLEGNPVCARYEIITPGKTVGDIAARAVGADIDWLVNSRELSAYVAAISNAFINRFVREGGGLLAVSAPSAPPGGYIPAGLTGNCAGLTGAALIACLDAIRSSQGLQEQINTIDECKGLEGNQFIECMSGLLTIAITAPINNSFVSATITITVSAAYKKGIERVEFYLNNTLIAADSSKPYAIDLDTTKFTNGSYTINALAVGKDGTAKQSSSVTIIINNHRQFSIDNF